MRLPLRILALSGVLAIGGLLGPGTAPAKAQGFGISIYRGYGGGYYGGGYGGYGGVPGFTYYGNGGHDFQPHWHTVQTPFGGYSYFGNGAHDFAPHVHRQTPYGITGYNGGFPYTQSYSPPTPYTYMPW